MGCGCKETQLWGSAPDPLTPCSVGPINADLDYANSSWNTGTNTFSATLKLVATCNGTRDCHGGEFCGCPYQWGWYIAKVNPNRSLTWVAGNYDPSGIIKCGEPDSFTCDYPPQPAQIEPHSISASSLVNGTCYLVAWFVWDQSPCNPTFNQLAHGSYSFKVKPDGSGLIASGPTCLGPFVAPPLLYPCQLRSLSRVSSRVFVNRTYLLGPLYSTNMSYTLTVQGVCSSLTPLNPPCPVSAQMKLSKWIPFTGPPTYVGQSQVVQETCAKSTIPCSNSDSPMTYTTSFALLATLDNLSLPPAIPFCYKLEYTLYSGSDCTTGTAFSSGTEYFTISSTQPIGLVPTSLTTPCSSGFKTGTPAPAGGILFNDKFIGSTGTSITGSSPSDVIYNFNEWGDLTSSGFDPIGFVSGGGATSLTLTSGGAYATYDLTGSSQDGIYSYTFKSSSLSPYTNFQFHGNSAGTDYLLINTNFSSQEIEFAKYVGGVGTVLNIVSVTLAINTLYTVAVKVVGTTVSATLNGTSIFSGTTVPTSSDNVILFGQTYGSAGDITFTNVEVDGILVAGTITPGITTETTATATATSPSSGVTPYSYQWYRSTDSTLLGTAISGQTSLSLSDSSLSPNTNYYYNIGYTDDNGNTTFSDQIEMTTLPDGTYFNDDFIGTTGTAIAGYEASPVNNGSDVWFDYYPTYGQMVYKSGGGITSALSGAFAVYPLSSGPQDGVFTFEVSSVSATSLVATQLHRDSTGSNYHVVNLDYNLGEVVVQEQVSGVASTLSTTSYTFATGTNYIVSVVTEGTSISVFINGVFIVTDTITTMTGTNILLGQYAGSAGDITYSNASFVASLTAGTVTAGTVTSSTATASATDATGGTPPYSYQWYRSTSSGYTSVPLDGQQSLNLFDTTIPTAASSYYYTLGYSDSIGSQALSNQIALTSSSGTTYVFDNFGGTPSGYLTGNSPDVVDPSGTQVWEDFSASGYGKFIYDTTSGVYASSFGTASGAYAIYSLPRNVVPSNYTTQIWFGSTNSDSVAMLGINSDPSLTNYVTISADFNNQLISMLQSVDSSGNAVGVQAPVSGILLGPVSGVATTNILTARVIASSISVDLNNQNIIYNQPITNASGSGIILGQASGTVGAIEYYSLQVTNI
jgi:hypothetical protein